MEKTLVRSEDKIKKLCDQLKNETLEPALREGERIVEEAAEKGRHIIHEAEKKAEHIIREAEKAVEKERAVFRSSLDQASRQSLETLRQAIEAKLFSGELAKLIETGTKQPDVIAKVINAIVEAIQRQGIESDLRAVIPKTVSPQEVSRALAHEVLHRLKEGAIEVGDFPGGAKVKLVDKKITLDMSSQAVFELLAGYVRKDFREILFGK